MSKLPRLRKKIKKYALCRTFSKFLEISNKFNDMVIFEKADLFYLINESIERHKTSFSKFF